MTGRHGRERPCPFHGKSSTPLLGEMLAKSLLSWTWGGTVVSASRAMSVSFTCLSTPNPPVCEKGGQPSPVHRMSISISLEIPDLVTPGRKTLLPKIHSRFVGQDV